MGADLKLVVDLLRPRADMTVLDVATGAGHTAAAVAPFVARVVATDLAPEMIRETVLLAASRNLHNLTSAMMDAESIAVRASSCDAVTCRIAPHHFPEVPAFLREVSRVLRPGGVFVLEDSCAPADDALDAFINTLEALRDCTHVRSYAEAEWSGMLRDVGLRVEASRIYRKSHDVDEWLSRAAADGAAQAAVYEHLNTASQPARAHFTLTYEAGRAVRYTDDKLLLRAVKA